jgi:hypothetical protein
MNETERYRVLSLKCGWWNETRHPSLEAAQRHAAAPERAWTRVFDQARYLESYQHGQREVEALRGPERRLPR